MAETEYIERKKALEECDWYANEFCECEYAIMPLKGALKNLPAADVRPVVLCKDCKWTETDGMEDPAIYCEKWDRWEMPPDGFCWLGEKREES